MVDSPATRAELIEQVTELRNENRKLREVLSAYKEAIDGISNAIGYKSAKKGQPNR